MYHIKPDKRSKKSAKSICDALLNCLKEKTFKEITIVDLQKSSTIGRSTFYRLFDKKEDILQYIYDQYLENIYHEFHAHPESSLSLYLLNHFYSYSYILEILVEENLTNIIIKAHNKFIPIYLKEKFKDSDLTQVSYDYISTLFSSMVVGLISVWIQRGKKETPEELYTILRTHLKTLLQID